jgi:hypothetical protein
MLFVTPAATLTPAEKKQGYTDETKHIWTLQTVTQTEFTNQDACVAAGTGLGAKLWDRGKHDGEGMVYL